MSSQQPLRNIEELLRNEDLPAPEEQLLDAVIPTVVSTAYEDRPQTRRRGLSLSKQFAIWEAVYVNGTTYEQLAQKIDVPKTTCYRYARKFDCNPPIEAISMYRPELLSTLILRNTQ
ncbi:hypothetical protein BC940DRAFT_322893 [Gongronella butleri]|nr:hypothetical protein BC940DRAFT_322893 [Gongronella butleri]